MSKSISLRNVALDSLVATAAMMAAPQVHAGNGFGGGFNNGFGNKGFGNGFGGKGFGNGFGGSKPGFGGGFKPGFGGGFKPGFGGKFNGNFGAVPPIVVPHKNHFHVFPGHFHFH